MRLFGSRPNYPTADEISLPDTWSVLEAQYGSHRLVGMLRDGVAPLMGHPGYKHQAGIALVLNHPRDDGMPGPEESEQVYLLEDAIQAKLEEGNQSLLVAKWFVRGCRELVFYSGDVKAMTRRLDEIASRGTRNRIQLTTKADPKWSILKAVTEAR